MPAFSPMPPTTTMNDDEAACRYAELITHITYCTLEMIQQAGATLAPEERDQALHILSYALNLNTAWPIAREMILLLAPKMELMGHRHDWMPYLERGIEESQRQGDLKVTAEYELQLGILYRMVSDFAMAKQVVQASIDHFSVVNDRQGQARGLNELASIEHLVNDYMRATEHVNSAVALLDKVDPELGMSYRVLGMIANNRGEWQKAEVHHRQALEIFEESHDRRKMGWSWHNLGVALYYQEKYSEAMDCYSKAATLLSELKDDHRWSMTQIGLGITYLALGDKESAIDCYHRAESIAQRLHDLMQLAMVQGNLGVVLMQHGNLEKAELRFLQAYRALSQVA